MLILWYNIYYYYKKGESIMTIHVDNNILHELQEFFGENFENCLNKAVKRIKSREVGDSLDVYIIFQLKINPSKFLIKSLIKSDNSKNGSAYIYVNAC